MSKSPSEKDKMRKERQEHKDKSQGVHDDRWGHVISKLFSIKKTQDRSSEKWKKEKETTASVKYDLRELISYKSICTLKDDGVHGHKIGHSNTLDDFQMYKTNFLSDSITDFSKLEIKGTLNANSPPTSYKNRINDNGKRRNTSKDSNRTNRRNRSKDKARSCDDQKGAKKQGSLRTTDIEIVKEKRPKLKTDEKGRSKRNRRPVEVHHSRKKFLVERGGRERSSAVKCSDSLNNNRVCKTPSPKALHTKKQKISSVAEDTFEIQKCKKNICLKKLRSEGKTYHSDNDNSKRSNFFSCKFLQNLDFNKAKANNNFPMQLSSAHGKTDHHHECKKKHKKIHFANHSDNKVNSCFCNCDTSCERNSHSDTYVICSPQKKKKGKIKSPHNIRFCDKFVKKNQCNDREDKMVFPNSSRLCNSYFCAHKRKRRSEISQGKKSRVRKGANCRLPYPNYNFTLRNIQKRKKIYFHFRKSRKCRLKKKEGVKKKKRDKVGTRRLSEEINKMINPMEEGGPPKGENIPVVDKADPHANVMQSETDCKPTECSIIGGEEDKDDLHEVDIEPPDRKTQEEQNAQQSSQDLRNKYEDPSKEDNPENEPLATNLFGEINNQINQPPIDSPLGKDKNEMAEGSHKELKITGKNFLKYDEEIFEKFYNDVHLNIGKIVTNRRKKYFLTYKIVKDSYFRILILNSEKLEKNILQAIAIQDVILYDKNVKIFSDPFYVRNSSKLYAVKFLKVFSLKYLKKIKKMSDIIFSDAEEGNLNVKTENCESTDLHIATEENASSTGKQKDDLGKNDLSKKVPTDSADEPPNGNHSEGTETNEESGLKGAIKEDTQDGETTDAQKNAPEGSNMSDGDGGNENKCSDNEDEEIHAMNNSSDNYDHVSNGGSKKINKGAKNSDKENPPKGNARINTKDKKGNEDVNKKKNGKDSPVKKKPKELSKSVNNKKSKTRSNVKVKSENEALSKEEEEHNYTGVIYNDKKKFYFNVHRIVDIIKMVKGSEEKTKFYLDGHNNNMKKKWKLLKKVEKTLFLENLVMDDEDVLFKRPKFFNCLIEESIDNYNVMYEAENGTMHLFENKLDRLKKKKGGNKAEADTSNKYIELKDEERGFKYIGYRVSFELKKDNKKKSNFKTGIIKYYSPKYKQFFIHHIENFKCNGSIAGSPKSTSRDMGYSRGGSKSRATTPSLYNNSKEHHPFADIESAQYGKVDQEMDKPISDRQNGEQPHAEVTNQNNDCIVRSEEMMYLNYEKKLDEENGKKKCDFIFSDVKGWYSPHFYNIKVLKTVREFERFDILDKNDKKKEQIDYNLLKRKDECSICKDSILFMKGHDHYTSNLSSIIYDLSSEMEKKEMDEQNMINVYWGIKCFICSKKFHANCLDDEVIITKWYDKNVLMKEYKKYIYKNSLKKDKKCFKGDKEKGKRSSTKKEEKSKRVKKNTNNVSDSKCTGGGGDSKSNKHKKNSSGKRTTGSSKNGSNGAVKEENDDQEEKSSKRKRKKGGKECANQNRNVKNNDSENDYKSDDKDEQNKSDELNDEEDTDTEENNCTKSKSKKQRKCINYVPAVKYNDMSYKKYVCKDCYRCIYCCESIYNYKQTPNIANYVICKTCNMVAHGSCCFPNVPDIYLFNWKCDECLKCNKCDYSNLCFINYNEWEFHLDCCINCYKEYEKKNFCIMCNEKYEIDDSNKWVQCDVCKFWIHLNCDKDESRNIETLSIKSINYKCPTCRSGSFHDKIERILYLFFLLDKYKNFTFHVPINFYIYWRIVKIPMNLYIMKKKIWEKKYSTILEFLYDFFLIIHNAKTVHMPNTPIYRNACIFEKKGKVIIKNMFNLENEDLNKFIDDCLETYKKDTNEVVTNDNNKVEEEGKNYDGMFTSGVNKVAASICNNNRDDILANSLDNHMDKKNVVLKSYHSENMNHLGYPGTGKKMIPTVGEFTKSGFYPNPDGDISHTGGINHRDSDDENFGENSLLNEYSMHEGMHNSSGRTYQSNRCLNGDDTFGSGIIKSETNVQSYISGTDLYNDYTPMEEKYPMGGAYDRNTVDMPASKDDMTLYNLNNNDVGKSLLNNNLLRKRKLEVLEKDITQYELHELFNFKSDCVFIEKNEEMFVPQNCGITSYNILTVNVKGKIYFNRSFDKFDEFDVCKVRKLHLLTGGSFSSSCGSAKGESSSEGNTQQGNHSSKEEKTPLVNDEQGSMSTEENPKGENKVNSNHAQSNVFVKDNIFMIDIRKDKVKMNQVVKVETRIFNPVNDAYKFLKCMQIVFFDQNGPSEHTPSKNVSSVGMNYLTRRVNYSSSDDESADDVTVEHVDRNKGEAISLDDIISLMEGRRSNGGSKERYQSSANRRNVPIEKNVPNKKIKLFNNDILKEYCHVCGCIEYKNPLIYCGSCGVSLHYACANISNPFLFNLTGYAEHRKEINQIFNIITRNFKCNQCIKCDKCDTHFSDAVRDTFYSNITCMDTYCGNDFMKKTTLSYFYNLKIEVVTLKKDKNERRRKMLADIDAIKFVEKGEVTSPMISELSGSPRSEEKSMQQPCALLKVELGESCPVNHPSTEKMEKQNVNDNNDQQGENQLDSNNQPLCSKKRKMQNSIDVDIQVKGQIGDPNTTGTIADVKEESKTVQTNSELELSPNKKKVSPKRRTSSEKNEENEKMDQSAPSSIVTILNIHDVTQRVIKCFCCGKSVHSECFYRIDNSGDSADKNDNDVHKKIVRTIFRRSYVKKNHSKKLHSPGKLVKGLYTSNEATLRISKNNTPMGSGQIGEEGNTAEGNNLITSFTSQDNETTTTTTEGTNAAAMMMVVPPQFKSSTPKKNKLGTHLSSSHIVSEDMHTSVKCIMNRNSAEECTIQSTSVNINSKAECSILSNHITVLKRNEINTSENSPLNNDPSNSDVIPSDEFVREFLKDEKKAETYIETVVINGKVYNKHLMNEIYDVIRQKKNAKVKNLSHLFIANIDEAVMYSVLNELLKGLYSYLNEKLNYYRSNRNLKSVLKMEKTDKSKKEKNDLFDKKNLIKDNRDDMKISGMLLKISALISETFSVPSKRRASNGKNGNRKRSSTSCRKRAINDNPSGRSMSYTASEHFKGNNPSCVQVNKTNDTLLFGTNADNAFATPPYSVHSAENHRNSPIHVDRFGTYEMKHCSSANGGNHFDGANNGKGVPNFVDMMNVNDVSATGATGLSSSAGLSDIGEHAEPKVRNLTSRKNKNGTNMNKSIYTTRCKFNEKNIEKLTSPTGKNTNSAYSSPKMNYSPIRKIINFDKTNNVKVNLNSVSNYNSVPIVNNTSNVNGMRDMGGLNSMHNINTISSVNSLNSVNNVSNFDGENLCRSSSVNLQNVSVDVGSSVYNLISVNNNVNTSNTVNVSDVLGNSLNANGINIVQNINVQNNNNTVINVNGIEGRKESFVNYAHMGNAGTINTMSSIGSVINTSGMGSINGVMTDTGMSNLDSALPPGGTLFGGNHTAHINSMNEMIHPFSKATCANDGENVYHYNDNMEACNVPSNVGSIFVNDANIHPAPTAYAHGKLDYEVNEASQEKNVYGSYLHSNEMNTYKNNYYFYNQLGNGSNSPPKDDMANVNMPLDYYTPIRNGSNNFNPEMNVTPFEGRINNESFEMNRKIMINVNASNEQSILYRDNVNVNLHSKEVSDVYRDRSSSSEFRNMNYGNISDGYEVRSQNKFTDINSVYNKNMNKKDQAHTKTLLKSNIPNLDKFINSNKNKKSSPASEKLAGEDNIGGNVCGSGNYNYNHRYGSNYSGSFDPSVFNYNENAPSVGNVNEGANVIAPEFHTPNENPNFSDNILHKENMINIRVEKNISNNADHVVKSVQKCILYNHHGKEGIHINMSNEVKYNMQNGQTYASGEAMEGAELARNKKGKLNFYCKNILIKKENVNSDINGVSGISTENANELESCNNNVSDQMEKKKRRGGNSASNGKERKKERSRANQSATENGSQNKNARRKKGRDKNEQDEEAEKVEKKPARNVKKKEEKKEMEEEKNQEKEKKKARPRKRASKEEKQDEKEKEKEQEQSKDKAKENKRKDTKGEKCEKDSKATKSSKVERETKRVRVKKEESSQEGQKEGKEEKRVRGKDKEDEKKRRRKTNENAEEKEKKKASESRTTQVKTKKETNEGKVDAENNNLAEDKLHEVKGNSSSTVIPLSSKFVSGSTYIPDVPKNCSMEGRCKMDDSYVTESDEELCLCSDGSESDNSTMNRGRAGSNRRRSRINKLSGFLKKNKFVLKSKFKRITPNTYLCHSCVVLYKSDFSFNAFKEEIASVEKRVSGNGNETSILCDDNVAKVKREISANEGEVPVEQNSIMKGVVVEGKEEQNPDGTDDGVTHSTNAINDGTGELLCNPSACEELVNVDAKQNGGDEGDERNEATMDGQNVDGAPPENDEKNVPVNKTHDCKGSNNQEEKDYFAIINEPSGKCHPDGIYWMNKISAHNNTFFNRAYLKGMKATTNIRYFLERKGDVYKCSICCMICEYKIGKGDNSAPDSAPDSALEKTAEDENDNLNNLLLCNACSLRHGHIQKYLISYPENSSYRSKTTFTLNKERSEKRKLYELVYLVIKMSFRFMYYKKNFFKAFCHLLDEFLRRNKSNVKLLYRLYFGKTFFKYDEFFPFFIKKVRRDKNLRLLFGRSGNMVMPFGSTHQHVLRYALNLFCVRLSYCCRKGKGKSSGATNSVRMSLTARKLLFCYYKKGVSSGTENRGSYFDHVVSYSLYFLHLYYLHKLHDSEKVRIMGRKKRRKVNHNLFLKMKNTEAFAGALRTLNRSQSEWPILLRENHMTKKDLTTSSPSSSACKKGQPKGGKSKLFSKRNAKGAASLLLYEKTCNEYKRDDQNEKDTLVISPFQSGKCQKKVKQYVKKIKCTIKNKLNLYVKIMLNMYMQESLNMIKWQDDDRKRLNRGNTKTCLLCHYGNYLYKGRLIPFYDIFIHSECLKWSLNCIQYYKLNSSSCECRSRIVQEAMESKVNVKKNPSNDRKGARSPSSKGDKMKSAESGSCSVKNEPVGGGTENADRNNAHTAAQVKSANGSTSHVDGANLSSTHESSNHLDDDTNKGGLPNGAIGTPVKREECCGESEAGQQNHNEENLSKGMTNPEENLNVKKSIKNIKLKDNIEWRENKNFFHNYEHIIEIEEDDVKEIIYDSINSTCFLCGYKNASIYCSNENCNIKFHLNCAFYSTMVKNSHQNIFFYYVKCFKLIKFNKDTIFYKYCHSSSNGEDKKLVQSLYEDIFPVHIIYNVKKVWCNKCWNAKKIYDSFYINKENMHCSSASEPSKEVEKVKGRPEEQAKNVEHAEPANCTAKDEEVIQGDITPACSNLNQDDTTTGGLNVVTEANDQINVTRNHAEIGENSRTSDESKPKRIASRKKINVMESLRNIYKHFIDFYYENESYYVMDRILYSINECVRIRYRNKPLNLVQGVLNKESKIKSKMKHLEGIINECVNKNEDNSFVNDGYQLIFQRNVQNEEGTNEQLIKKSDSCNNGDEHEESNLHTNDVNVQNIIDNKNMENIFKSYFILKYFLYIGREIALNNEEYFFLKKKENSFVRFVYSNDEQTYNVYLPHVLYSNAVDEIATASCKDTTTNVKDKSSKGNQPTTNEQVISDKNEQQTQPHEQLRKICYTTFIDDESEPEKDNSENNLSSSSDNEMEETEIAHYYSRERKDKRMKSINLYFDVKGINRKVNITKLQQVSNYSDCKESNDAVALRPNVDEEIERNGNDTTTTAAIGIDTRKASLERSTCESNSVTEKNESFLNTIISDTNDVFIKRTNEKLFSNYKFNCPNSMNLPHCRIIKVGCHNILHMGEIVKYNGEKRIYPCGFVNMRIFFNLPSAYLFHIYKNAIFDDQDEKKKTLQRIFLQIRATYIFSITLKNENFFFSIMLFPLISVDHFSVTDAQKFVLAESHDIQEVYEKFLSLFNFANGDNNVHKSDEYKKYVDKYSHLLELMQSYILKSVQHNVKTVDPHDFFGLTLPCVIYQMKYKLFKYLWKCVNHRVKNYIRRSGKRAAFKRRVKNCTREVIYNDNLLCKYSNLDTSIFKENEKEKEKNMRKTVKYKYNINSAMSYRYLMNISSNSRLYVKKSSIHGYGLYTCEFINEGEPVIEYIGEYIRNIISDKREKYYDKIESSCYMFRLNENIIIDATKWGNVSRFINHSCEPNCFCKIVSCDQNLKHIVIFAKRDIVAHEEITYDYQFGVESEGKKLICLCGSSTCLGRMN
ncbi:SET-domain protein [Plasmodium coatneyi]|uniref:SET-domain protein n=1 Tax=Plasmodium coatneyi TaxID=208452 RepID=A0A1B1E2R0_9APIC|nr:SET-domain protein [Plasmodium coatneyi]ANQ09312.1 SET-domain protein [Plasmodium coatneyi]